MCNVIKTSAATYTVNNNGIILTESILKIPIVGKNMIFTGEFKLIIKPPRELKTLLNNRGYLTVKLGKHTKMVHRLVAEAFIVNIHNKPYVNHIDGNKLNNHVSNLEWCTHKENMKHARDTNLFSTQGLLNSKKALLLNSPFKKLPDIAVQDIRDNFKKCCKIYGAMAFSKKYSVSTTTISYIVNFKKAYVN